MKKLLLHVCCAPCSTAAIERLVVGWDVTLFFSNSNIFPEEEYEKRLSEAKKIATSMGVPIVVDDYDHHSWLESVKGFETEPEKGKRCEKCFEYNLSRAASYAIERGFEAFTTTLTISPYKDSAVIFKIGKDLGPFLEENFKKKDGFGRSLQLSDEKGLYRQDYCGCEFSRMGPGKRSMESPKE